MAPRADEQIARADLTGMTLGDFHLEKKLGQGGMGQVYLGEQVSLKRKVAVKVMRPDVTASATALARFKSEAQAVARLTHPNIVQVYMIAEQEGLHYIALEFVEGSSLGQYMARKGALPVDLTLRILKQVAAALAHAGEAGIVHRDIKPENILITRKADAKVTDFGLARSTEENEGQVNLTQSGVIVGTPVYMSPEQVQGKKPDCRTDIYSLGVTAYHMLAGRPPFKGQSAFDLALQHVQAEPMSLREIRPEVPEALEAVVKRMMAKNPDDRFANGRELVRALSQVPAAPGEFRTGEMLTEATVGVSNRKAERRNSTLPLDRKPGKQKERSVALWIGVGAVAVLSIPFLLYVGVRALRALSSAGQPPDSTARVEPPDRPDHPLPDRAPPDRPPSEPPPARGDKPDPREEERIRSKLHKGSYALADQGFMRQFEPSIELADYYLRTRQIDKADSYFQELKASGVGKPALVVWLGEIGTAIVLSEKGEVEGSNDLFVQLARRPGLPGLGPRERTPRMLMHHPWMKPHVMQALDRNSRNGKLPDELQQLKRRLGAS